MLILQIVRKLGLVPLVKIILTPIRKARAMWFPTFDSDVHDMVMNYNDYSRFATIALAVQRIQNEQIDGSMAEAGVFQGETSKIIHHLAPDRAYYLFDTFEGFPEQDLEHNQSDTRFKNTSVDLVTKNIGTSDNIFIGKGYVPDTFNGLENEKFAFVLLDLDLYEPTLASLEFFYPRMSSGGFIIVHDYNNSESNWGCKRSLDKFMEDKPENIIDVADILGSAMFRKL
ncbi:MAG: TylF/MycF/NovP-related O-methyltransferase [Candidatus Hatepunaea meridiana]|nr:TylF/MycF/NovP-related O-methyltransferase [Candidatus Hatepunaea meridiana]